MGVSSSLELVIPTLFHKLRHFKSYLRLEVYVHWQLEWYYGSYFNNKYVSKFLIEVHWAIDELTLICL